MLEHPRAWEGKIQLFTSQHWVGAQKRGWSIDYIDQLLEHPRLRLTLALLHPHPQNRQLL